MGSTSSIFSLQAGDWFVTQDLKDAYFHGTINMHHILFCFETD